MKYIFCLCCTFLLPRLNAQTAEDRAGVERALLNYVEGFYEGDTIKLMESLKPGVHKIGYWKNKTSGAYDFDGQMTYADAIAYSKNVLLKKNFAKPGSVKKAVVLDVSEYTASGKVYAWWGIDYILLSRHGNKWMIEQVLWEGPPQAK
ncbi:MAG: nuclear transport factor 2 family protein [Saprospiraceae bacterium]|nr:nuclear transport factor 2 family protein [Saprospiraceae bacterium]